MTPRDQHLLRFALRRFLAECYARANEAAQDTQHETYRAGAAEAFLADAKDTERLLAGVAQEAEPASFPFNKSIKPHHLKSWHYEARLRYPDEYESQLLFIASEAIRWWVENTPEPAPVAFSCAKRAENPASVEATCKTYCGNRRSCPASFDDPAPASWQECAACKGTGEQAGWTDAGGPMRCVPESCDECRGTGRANQQPASGQMVVECVMCQQEFHSEGLDICTKCRIEGHNRDLSPFASTGAASGQMVEPVAWWTRVTVNSDGRVLTQGVDFTKPLHVENGPVGDGNYHCTIVPLYTSAPTLPAHLVAVPRDVAEAAQHAFIASMGGVFNPEIAEYFNRLKAALSATEGGL